MRGIKKCKCGKFWSYCNLCKGGGAALCKHGMQKYRCKICGKTLERMVEQYDHLMDSHMALISRMASMEQQQADMLDEQESHQSQIDFIAGEQGFMQKDIDERKANMGLKDINRPPPLAPRFKKLKEKNNQKKKSDEDEDEGDVSE